MYWMIEFLLLLGYNIVKSERKTDFIIQKRAKKTLNPNPEGTAIVSPIKIIKVTDRYNHHPPHEFSPTSIVSNNIANLLSTKQLEPVQVHSVVSTVGRPTKPEKVFVQTLKMISTPPSSKKIDEIK